MGRKNTIAVVNKRLDFVLGLMVQFVPALEALELYSEWTNAEYKGEPLSEDQYYADIKAVKKRCSKDAKNENISEEHALMIKCLEYNVRENYLGKQSQSATNAIAPKPIPIIPKLIPIIANVSM